MTSTTLTPGAGDYFISLSATFEAANLDTHVVVSIYVNGVQVSGSERRTEIRKNRFDSCFSQALVTGVTAGQAIEGRFRSLDGDSITMTNRSLVVIEID